MSLSKSINKYLFFINREVREWEKLRDIKNPWALPKDHQITVAKLPPNHHQHSLLNHHYWTNIDRPPSSNHKHQTFISQLSPSKLHRQTTTTFDYDWSTSVDWLRSLDLYLQAICSHWTFVAWPLSLDRGHLQLWLINLYHMTTIAQPAFSNFVHLIIVTQLKFHNYHHLITILRKLLLNYSLPTATIRLWSSNLRLLIIISRL